jgi:hypothetical protein
MPDIVIRVGPLLKSRSERISSEHRAMCSSARITDLSKRWRNGSDVSAAPNAAQRTSRISKRLIDIRHKRFRPNNQGTANRVATNVL